MRHGSSQPVASESAIDQRALHARPNGAVVAVAAGHERLRCFASGATVRVEGSNLTSATARSPGQRPPATGVTKNVILMPFGDQYPPPSPPPFFLVTLLPELSRTYHLAPNWSRP